MPTDHADIDAFVVAFNSYTDFLRRGVVNLKAWKRAVEAWGRMIG